MKEIINRKDKLTLVVICLIGGTLTLLSYLWVISTNSKDIDVFWGEFPQQYLPLYYISMIVSALGYFVFTLFIIFRINVKKVKGLSFYIFSFLYFLLLIPSAVWMPLIKLYIQNPSDLLWITIRLVLLIVGGASLAVFLILLGLSRKYKGLFYWASMLTSFYFFFHTGILDAFLWAYFFQK